MSMIPLTYIMMDGSKNHWREGNLFWWSSYYMSGTLYSLLLLPIILKISIAISALLLKILTCKMWLIFNPIFSLLHHAVSSFLVETYYCIFVTLIPCSPFFLQQLRTLWFWQYCTVLNQWNLLIIIKGAKHFCYLLFLVLRSWNCCSANQSMVPDSSFVIMQRGKITAKKSILLIIHMCSKRDDQNLCPFSCAVFSNRFQNCQDTHSVKYPVPNSYGIFMPIIETKNSYRMKLTAKIATFPLWEANGFL